MKWNDAKGLITYRLALHNIKTILGIPEISHYSERPELFPYTTYILDYISRRLIQIQPDSDIKALIQEVFNIADWGADLIIDGGTRVMLMELGIADTDIYIEGEEIPYIQDRFVFTWSNVLTALEIRLKFQYQYLLGQDTSSCQCPCPNNDWTRKNEEWSSGFYPEDENYPYYSGASSDNWRSINPTQPGCNRI